jgi:Leucine-rich repeat (LRR) protein
MMTDLIWLTLDHNIMTGPLPSEIGLMTNLRVLKLEHNNFTYLPSEIYHLTNLQDLSLDWALMPTVPTELNLVTDLVAFSRLGRTSNASSYGALPLDLFSTPDLLKEIDLSSSFLSGTIPTEVGLLTARKKLHLKDNIISGTIPTEIGLCTRLVAQPYNWQYPFRVGTSATWRLFLRSW